jgi:iron complex outermembrane recepter protein
MSASRGPESPQAGIAAKHGAAAALMLLCVWSATGSAQTDEAMPSPETAPAADSSTNTRTDPASGPSTEATAPVGDEAASGNDLETIPVVSLDRQAPQPAENNTTQLDDVVVTAQKLQQSVKDVPISITVVSDKFVAEKGIVDLREAMLFVPNVKVESAGFFAAPRARGFSFNNNNKAIEPPLGIAIDGFPYTAPTYFASGVFDINRIEVLRGPQGTTFGKNTTAGLIHVITNDPEPEWGGRLDMQGGDFGRQRLELAGGGPLIEDLMDFRIALLTDEREGFIQNTTHRSRPELPDKFRGYTHEGVRAKLMFPDVLSSSFKLTYEYVALAQFGAGEELVSTTQPFRDVVLAYDPDADFIEGNYIASIDGADGREATVETMSLEWKSFFGDWGWTGLAGRSVLDTTLAVDADFTPVPALHGVGSDRNPTTTFELRAERAGLDGLLGMKNAFGADLGNTNLLLGVFYQKRDLLDSQFQFHFFDAPFLELTLAAGGDLAFLPPDAVEEDFHQNFDQTGDVLAAFGQAQWHFLPQWNLQTGLRLSQEKKHAVWKQVFNTPPPNVLMRGVGLEEFEATRSLKETHVQPKISLQYDPVDEVSLFAHWARAFKGGGYNAFAFSGTENELVYKPEELDEWGIDLKTSPILDGTLRLNLSIYRMDATDFQVLARVRKPGTIGLGITKVENAPHARAQGAEGDIMWLPFNGMTVIATLGYNDTKYLDFRTNECPANSAADPKGADAQNQCNATGKSFPFAPKVDSTLTASWVAPLPFWDLNLNLGTTVEYQSSQLLDLDLDERKRQPAFTRYRANIGIASPAQGWSFQLIGNNLTNQVTSVRKGDVFANQILSIQEPPREIFGQFRWTF